MPHVSTASKAWLHLKCPSWHKVPRPEVVGTVGERALFGTYIHKIAQNELLRQTGQSTGSIISDKMTAEQEAAFNPHYTPEIGAPFDVEEWGNNVFRMVEELRGLFPELVWEAEIAFGIGLTEEGIGGGLNHSIKDREYDAIVDGLIPGTIDVLGHKYRRLEETPCVVVVDWKTGEEEIEPRDNPQLYLAARAAIRHYAFPPDTEVYVGIGNIRKNTLKFYKTSVLELNQVVLNVLRSKNQDGLVLNPGDHCARCPNQEKCPALSRKILDNPVPPEHWTADQLAIAAIQARDLGKKYRELLIHKAESDPSFKTKYLKKGSQGWRLSVFEGQKE